MSRHPVSDDDHLWRGPGTLTVAGGDHRVDLLLTGFFQPIDGRFSWAGRVVRPEPDLAGLPNGKHPAVLTTAHGRRPCVVSDRDLWGRWRVHGSSTPPFPVDLAADPTPELVS